MYIDIVYRIYNGITMFGPDSAPYPKKGRIVEINHKSTTYKQNNENRKSI